MFKGRYSRYYGRIDVESQQKVPAGATFRKKANCKIQKDIFLHISLQN